MTDLYEDGGLLFDQSGQLVENQYNADVLVVNHINDGPSGKRCPSCKASPISRTSLVWAEHTRRIAHGTQLLSNLALRAAPPRHPWMRQRMFNVVGYAVAVLFPMLGGILWVCLVGFQMGGLLLFGVWFAATMVFVVFRLLRRAKLVAADRAQYEAAMGDYRPRRRRWERSWFCGSCGLIAAEEPSST